jgi:hypothetical protein
MSTKIYNSEELSIRLLIPQEDCGNLNTAGAMVRHKDNAVPANTFPVPPSPLPAPEWDDVTAEGVGFEFVNGSSDARLDITRQPPQLPLGFIGKLNVPVHA